MGVLILKNINNDLFHLEIIIRQIRRGNEEVTVYNIKYVLAWIRSGCTPHPKIIINVGIKDDSKKI